MTLLLVRVVQYCRTRHQIVNVRIGADGRQALQNSLALLEERLPESPRVRDLRDKLAALLHERTARSATG